MHMNRPAAGVELGLGRPLADPFVLVLWVSWWKWSRLQPRSLRRMQASRRPNTASVQLAARLPPSTCCCWLGAGRRAVAQPGSRAPAE